MYIIAKRKDYYDGVVGTVGVDKTIVYDREPVEFEGEDMPQVFRKKSYYTSFREREDNPFYKLGNSHIKKEYFHQFPHHSYFIVGFCGKLYVGFKLYNVNTETSEYDNVITTITYDKDYMVELFENKTFGGYFQDNLNHVLQFNALDWFRDMRTPCFVYDQVCDVTHIDLNHYRWNHNSKFFINPLLKDYEFYKVFDSFQAFQEISMFMGGVLGKGEKEIVEVQDKYKIAQHGFDKWSFRKMPENGKV
jgi:hypothetical protein